MRAARMPSSRPSGGIRMSVSTHVGRARRRRRRAASRGPRRRPRPRTPPAVEQAPHALAHEVVVLGDDDADRQRRQHTRHRAGTVKTAGLAVLRGSPHRTRVWSVTAVWLRFRAEMRARWRAWLALAVFAGVTCGVVIALAAASARTASAYHRYLVASNHADAYVDPGFAFGGDESLDLGRIARLPEVEAAERTAMPFVIAKSASGRSIYPCGPAAVQFMAPMDGRSRDTIDRQKVLRGREPDPRRPDEALLDSKAARALGVDVGDSITLRLAWGEASGDNSDLVLTADPRTATVGPLVTVRVVGVSANSRASVDAGVVHLSPGFYAAHGGAKLVRVPVRARNAARAPRGRPEAVRGRRPADRRQAAIRVLRGERGAARRASVDRHAGPGAADRHASSPASPRCCWSGRR